jgi:hypothetical protein
MTEEALAICNAYRLEAIDSNDFPLDVFPQKIQDIVLKLL